MQESCWDGLWWEDKSVWRGKWCYKSTTKKISVSWEKVGCLEWSGRFYWELCSFSKGFKVWEAGGVIAGGGWCWAGEKQQWKSRRDLLRSNYWRDFSSWWFLQHLWELLPSPGPACGLQALLITRQQDLNHPNWACFSVRAELWQRLGLYLLCVKIRWACSLQLAVRDQLSCVTCTHFTASFLERQMQVVSGV